MYSSLSLHFIHVKKLLKVLYVQKHQFVNKNKRKSGTFCFAGKKLDSKVGECYGYKRQIHNLATYARGKVPEMD